jgi:hypothetical protein
MRRAVQILLVAATWLSAGPVAAEPCPVDPMVMGPGPAADDVETRLKFIERSLRDGARKSTAWAAGWGTTYGLTAATLLIVSRFVEAETRLDLYVGAASSTIGLLVRAAIHPRVIREDRWVRRKIREKGRTCETLNMAERALARSAKAERRGRSIMFHAGALVYNVGIGLVLGVALKRPLSGIRQAAVGGMVGQVMILTQPTTSVRALDQYRGPRFTFTPLMLPRGAGVGIAGSF